MEPEDGVVTVKEEDAEAANAKSNARFEVVVGTHEFTLQGYSLAKGLGAGKYISSQSFSAGGYEWAIYIYPDGKNKEDNSLYVSVFIALVSEGENVRALFELVLLDQSEKREHKRHSHFDRSLESGPYTLKYRGSMWGYKRFFRRAVLEQSEFLKDDTLSFTCKVGVVVSSVTIGPKVPHGIKENVKQSTPKDNKRRSGSVCKSHEANSDGSSESSSVYIAQMQDLRIQEKKSRPAEATDMET